MKMIIKKLLALSIVGCAFVGCTTKGDLETSDGAKTSVQPISDEHFVGIDQVLSYIGEKRPQTKGAQNAYRLEAYNSAEGDTLMYIVNYGNGDGWQILSSDTRTPAVIAEGYSGQFSLEEGSPAVQVWMDMTATDIANIRNLPDEKLNFSEDEIAAHKAFWSKHSGGGDGTRALDDPIVGPPLHGYWAVDVYSRTVVTDSLEHMLPHWAQWAPYNTFCPLRTDTIGRAPAGCVAIAGAETLYYLHSIWGTPSAIVDSCSCEGYVHNYLRTYGDSISDIWGDMHYEYRSTSADAEALLIAYVGDATSTQYNNKSASATFGSLKTGLSNFFGINCRKRSYDADTVKHFLLQNLPVVIGATNQLIPWDGRNHCFVIDGYKRTYTRTTYLHYWVPGLLDLDPGIYEPYYTYSNTNYDITAIKINWGWSTQWISIPGTIYPLNDGWYGLTADWYVDMDENRNGVIEGNEHYNYNYYVTMIYGFNL